MNDKPQATKPTRLKWVRAESREEAELDRIGWRAIAQETRLDNSLWCLWANMEDTTILSR